MPLKKLKTDTAGMLTLEWVLHVKHYKLALNKDDCVGCQMCSAACPKEAITLAKQPKASDGKAQKAKIDVDLEKCNFCGICDVLCPYGAVKVTLNDEHALAVLEKESFPQYIRDIQTDTSHYPTSFQDWKEACPLGLITVGASSDGTVKVDVKKDKCPCCKVCEDKMPEGVMKVRKFIHGKALISQEKCPEGCRDCLDVCPITSALYLSDVDKKLHVNENFCVYCGACKVVCPVDEALELKRIRINHTPVHSGAWNKALERLTSPLEMTKELKTKGSKRAVESVAKRLEYKVK